MSDIAVTFTAASNMNRWEEMKPAIIRTWLHQARNLKHMVLILRVYYNIVSTEKICRTRLEKWGLRTYRPRQTRTHQGSWAQLTRRRKGTKSEAGEDDSYALLSLHPQGGTVSPPHAFRRSEFVFYSIDVFLSHTNKELPYQQPKARDLIHPKLKEDYSLSWAKIADLYQAAEGYFKGECLKKFINTIKRARLEIRILTGLLEPRAAEFESMWQLAMITRFWRVCHRLIKLDLRWPQYGYSFLLDFLLEFERLMNSFYGKLNPLGQLLRAIVQLDKDHVQMVVRSGASRTISVMAPVIDEKQRRVVMFAWTDFMYRQ